MNVAINEAVDALSEKEKQTLRLIVRGHDAKSTARTLGLSVHTINERLRDARRKMAVSSSREAARLLLEAEGGLTPAPPPQSFGDTQIGEDANGAAVDEGSAPSHGAGRAYRHPRILIGAFVMTFALGLLILTTLPQTGSTPSSTPVATDATPMSEVVATARDWLALVDAGRWDESYRATGSAFRKLNTAQVWASVSHKVRVPLGKVISRSFLSQQNLPAPPQGYEVVKFRTSFANKANAVETVTLERESGEWRVVGVTIE